MEHADISDIIAGRHELEALKVRPSVVVRMLLVVAVVGGGGAVVVVVRWLWCCGCGYCFCCCCCGWMEASHVPIPILPFPAIDPDRNNAPTPKPIKTNQNRLPSNQTNQQTEPNQVLEIVCEGLSGRQLRSIDLSDNALGEKVGACVRGSMRVCL